MRLFLLIPAILLAVACNAPGAGRPRAEASDVENVQNRFDAKMLGLTAEIDRLSRRVTELEARLGTSAPPPVPPAAMKETPPERTPEPAPPPPPAKEPVKEPPPPPEEEPAPPAEAPPPEADEAAPAIAWTGILFDVRTLSEMLPPGRAYSRWRVVDDEGEDLITHSDVVRKGSTFWQAAEGVALGVRELPLTGETPLRVVPTRAAVLANGEARLEVDAEAAALIRGFPGLSDLLANGKVAILLLAPPVR